VDARVGANQDGTQATGVRLERPPHRRAWLSPLNRRRWDNFKVNELKYAVLAVFPYIFDLPG
jgi:hypothetical protein